MLEKLERKQVVYETAIQQNKPKQFKGLRAITMGCILVGGDGDARPFLIRHLSIQQEL